MRYLNIGETEKNRCRIFDAAEKSNGRSSSSTKPTTVRPAVGQRSEVKDAHDRYANVEIALPAARRWRNARICDPGHEPEPELRRNLRAPHARPGDRRGRSYVATTILPLASASEREVALAGTFTHPAASRTTRIGRVPEHTKR
jgi:hypothetical protein